MKYIIAVVLSAVLICTIHQPHTNNQVQSAKPKPVSKATREIQKVVSEQPAQQQAPAPVQQPLTDKQRIMQEAGIAPSDWGAVDYIVSHESSWQSGAINPTSGSCGLVQELPCGKSGCTLGDAVCQLKWASNYAVTRYGSWWGAHSFWLSNQWW